MGLDETEIDRLEDELDKMFAAQQIDYVPDPMVLRAAELFVLGNSGSHHVVMDGSRDDVWAVLDKNLDGILAFFHLLMTRERVPLIDYGVTFPDFALHELLGELAVPVHPPYLLYQQLLGEARDRVVRLQLDQLDPAMLDDIADELGAVGYEWYPDEAQYLDRSAGERVAATFVTGGVIFGAYAGCTGSEHVLQTKRARLFAELSVQRASGGLWGRRHEAEVFERLTAEGALHVSDRRLPPSVVPMLLNTERPDSAVALLQAALEIRTSDLGEAYREWHAAGAFGVDATLANEVAEMVGRKARERDVRATPAGTATALEIDSDGADAESGPADGAGGRIRAWLVERRRTRRHRKLMLRMSLPPPTLQDLTSRLKELWYAS